MMGGVHRITITIIKYVQEAGDTLLFPNMTFHMMGGVQGWNLTDVTIQLEVRKMII